jgi:UDP-glucuronate decarboxylase
MITKPMLEDFSSLSQQAEIIQALEGKRVYVTGSTGQIGWYLIHLILFMIHQGKLNCALTAHVRSPEKLAAKFPDHASLACTFIVEENASQPLAKTTFDLVIHCASKASPKFFSANPVDVMIPNGILVNEMLEKIKNNTPGTLFVYFSTTGVTGFIPDEQRPSTEDDYGPLSCTDLGNCYLESKRFGEMLTLAYAKQYAIPVYIVRPSITYGPGFDLDDGRSYADFIQCLLKGQAIKLTSDGSAIRNFLYISDFIKGLFSVISSGQTGSVFNIASPRPVRILDLATLLNTHIDQHSLGPVEHAPATQTQYTRVNFKSTDASVDKLSALGWSQEVDLLDGFKRTMQHYQEIAK